MKSSMRFIKSALEYRTTEEIGIVPKGLRGIYALYDKRENSFDAVYVGMSGKGSNGRIQRRLISHLKNNEKEWTHFSYYEVWDNVSDLEIAEIEGLFRQLYRLDEYTNFYNTQQSHKPLNTVRKETEKLLGVGAISKRRLGV